MANPKNRQPVRIASLVGQRMIEPDQIEEAVKKIHHKADPINEEPSSLEDTGLPALEKIEKATDTENTKKPPSPDLVVEEKRIRVSVATPPSIYIKAKTVALKENTPALSHFYLRCVESYLKLKGEL